MVNAGQFFVLGFDGKEVPASLEKLCKSHGLSGVILFARNIKSPPQLKKLTRGLRSVAGKRSFIISVDQEGGRFQRLKPPAFGSYPPACEVSADTALELGKRMGQELASLGINVDYAPVLDVNTNPDNPIIGVRSFNEDPYEVTKIAELFVKGLASMGITACGKHFPGHGDTSQDSHLTLPVVDHPQERLQSIELVPFRELVGWGLRMIMTAHVLYPTLDPEHPATFSPRILGDLLRQELGFEGLVITDDMGMAGALSQADLSEACVEAFAAGCDLLMVCEHWERHEEIISALEEEIDKSPALQKRAQESTKRIEQVMNKM